MLFDCVNYGIHDSSRTHVINHTARESADTNTANLCTRQIPSATAIRFTRVTSRPLRRQRISLTSPARPANAPIVRHIPSPPPPRPHTVFRSSAAASARITLTSPGPLTPIARHIPPPSHQRRHATVAHTSRSYTYSVLRPTPLSFLPNA